MRTYFNVCRYAFYNYYNKSVEDKLTLTVIIIIITRLCTCRLDVSRRSRRTGELLYNYSNTIFYLYILYVLP